MYNADDLINDRIKRMFIAETPKCDDFFNFEKERRVFQRNDAVATVDSWKLYWKLRRLIDGLSE